MPQMPIQRQNGSRAEAVHMETRDSLTSPGAAVQGLASNDRTRVKSLTSKYEHLPYHIISKERQ